MIIKTICSSNRIFYFLLSVSIVVISSCKEEDIIGLEVQPPSDQLNVVFTDTLSLITYSVREDSLKSNQPTLLLAGSYTDPVFGKVKAEFVTQIRIPSTNITFQAGSKADSIVLSLAYKGFYGDTSVTQSFSVYQLNDILNKDSTYYSNHIFDHNPVQLGTIQMIPSPTDSISLGGIKQPAQVRIPLNLNLADDILSLSGKPELSTQENWLDYFKGIAIKTSQLSGPGAILYFDHTSVHTKVTLYYNDSLTFDLLINENSARVNLFDHNNYSGTVVGMQFADSTLGQSNVYVQATGGVKTRVFLPNLKELEKAGTIVINKAELVLKIDDGTLSGYEAVGKLIILKLDSLGKTALLPDQFEGIDFIGGSYNTSSKEYRFNLARHLQDVMSGRISDHGMVIVASSAVSSANRSVLFGGAKSNPNRMTLRITYTRVP